MEGFPRTRGDRPSNADALMLAYQIPPQARGLDPAQHRCRGVVTRFPRTRGDRPKAAQRGELNLAIPPHARG